MLAKVLLSCTLFSFIAACPGDPLCQECKGGYCTYCVNSYPNGVGVCTPTAIVPGCNSYSDINTCVDCKNGYLQSLTGNTCTAFNSTFGAICLSAWSNSSYCEVCQNNGYFSIATGTCPTTTTCSDPNCTNCYISSGAGVCFQCAAGYAIWSSNDIGSTCVAVTSPNCFSTNSTTSCNDCNNGFYLDSPGSCAGVIIPLLTGSKSAKVMSVLMVSVFLVLIKA